MCVRARVHMYELWATAHSPNTRLHTNTTHTHAGASPSTSAIVVNMGNAYLAALAAAQQVLGNSASAAPNVPLNMLQHRVLLQNISLYPMSPQEAAGGQAVQLEVQSGRVITALCRVLVRNACVCVCAYSIVLLVVRQHALHGLVVVVCVCGGGGGSAFRCAVSGGLLGGMLVCVCVCVCVVFIVCVAWTGRGAGKLVHSCGEPYTHTLSLSLTHTHTHTLTHTGRSNRRHGAQQR